MKFKQYLKESKNIDNIKMSSKEFYDLKKLLFKYGKKDIKDEKIAFACRFEGRNVIVINDDEFSKLDKDYQKIIVVHEMVHIFDKIDNEEETDRRSLKHLNKKQQDILKNLWKQRHGHEYEE